MTKHCATSGCKAPRGFGRDKNTPDGLARKCRDCNAEYMRGQRTANPEASRRSCRKWKAANKAAATAGYKRWRAANPEKAKAASSKWQKNNPREAKDYALRWKYGMTLDEHEALSAQQGGACAACHEHGRKLFVDHCHQTGKIRGLLCHHCNTAIGLAKDSAERLDMLAAYLRKK